LESLMSRDEWLLFLVERSEVMVINLLFTRSNFKMNTIIQVP
jgi:hypothetical protein